MNLFKLFFFFSLVLSLNTCDFDKLKSELLFEAPLNQEILNFPIQNNFYYEIPEKMGIEEDVVLISEPSERTIKIFKVGKLERALRSKPFYSDSSNRDQLGDLPNVQEFFLAPLMIPGVIATTSKESFYVLNYIPEDKSKNNEGVYNFLHINFDGRLNRVVYHQTPSDKEEAQNPSKGFSNIEWMDVDDEDRLWLKYKDDQVQNILQGYEAGKLLHHISEEQCFQVILANIKKSKNEEYSCETFYPFSSGKVILLVGKVETIEKEKDDIGEKKYKFKERIFVLYTLNSQESHKIFTHESDPQETPYLTHGEESFIIWVTEDYQNFKLELYNIKANLEKKFTINLPGNSHSWRNTYTTLRGRVHSIRVSKDFLSIYEWY